MTKIVDRLLLFFYSIIILIASCFVLGAAGGLLGKRSVDGWIDALYEQKLLQLIVIIVTACILLASLRFFYVSIRRGGNSTPSIDQRTEFGDIRISMETVENLSLKAASKHRGVKDLKARIRVADAGLEIVLRAIVDGESPIPQLTEEIQRSVKDHVEETTGIPVAVVTVFVANIIQSQTFKSRVE